MERHKTTEGMEVSHPRYGRGCILDLLVTRTEGTDDVTVLFYETGEPSDVPVYSLSPASEVASVEATQGTVGLDVEIDDGFYSLRIVPDGEGSGYSVSLHAGNATLDEAELSSEGFL